MAVHPPSYVYDKHCRSQRRPTGAMASPNFWRILSFCASRGGVPHQILFSFEVQIFGPTQNLWPATSLMASSAERRHVTTTVLWSVGIWAALQHSASGQLMTFIHCLANPHLTFLYLKKTPLYSLQSRHCHQRSTEYWLLRSDAKNRLIAQVHRV